MEQEGAASRSIGMDRLRSPLFAAFSLVALALVVMMGVALWGGGTYEGQSSDKRPQPALLQAEPPSAAPAAAFAPDEVTVAVPPADPTPRQTATPTAIPTATPAPTIAAIQPAVALGGIRHAWQTWNNCGPATLTMNLSYFGLSLDQAEAGAALRRHEDDKNVGPDELAAYARSQGLHATVRVNGSTDLLRTLLSNEIPVLIETWHEDEAGDGLGHYRLLTGYDDAAGYWIAYDTFDANNLVNPEGSYAGIRIPYGELDRLWRYFNRTYILIYPPEQADLIGRIPGAASPTDVMWGEAIATAQAETAASAADPIAWFNLGTSANALGDTLQAAEAFDRARALGLPWRMFWYQFGAFEAYAGQARYADLLSLADETLRGTTSIEEVHYWRGIALAGLGETDAARTAWQQAVALNPAYQPAVEALAAS
jgi:tetratricopeptide (TPR) repeat protein